MLSMLYVFFGTDVVGARSKAHEFVAKLEERGTATQRVTTENFTSGMLADAAGSVSLFGGEEVYVIDTPSGKKEVYDEVAETLSMLAESSNTFVVIEEKLLAPEKKKFAKHAEDVVEVTAEKIERFNAFALADALGNKDKKSLWILLNTAQREGLSSEEIIGTLFWQIKALRLAAKTNSASEAGMKDFPYNKAKRSLSKFKEGEVDQLSRELVSLYHDGHAGVRDIDLSLEKWALSL